MCVVEHFGSALRFSATVKNKLPGTFALFLFTRPSSRLSYVVLRVCFTSRHFTSGDA